MLEHHRKRHALLAKAEDMKKGDDPIIDALKFETQELRRDLKLHQLAQEKDFEQIRKMRKQMRSLYKLVEHMETDEPLRKEFERFRVYYKTRTGEDLQLVIK